jgi:hypothetical protein
MFTRHAKFQGPEFSNVGLRNAMPCWLAAAHANDNSRGCRRRTGQRRSPPLILACRWVLTGENRLECRWKIESPDDVCVEEPDGRPNTRGISGLPLTVLRPLSGKAAAPDFT